MTETPTDLIATLAIVVVIAIVSRFLLFIEAIFAEGLGAAGNHGLVMGRLRPFGATTWRLFVPDVLPGIVFRIGWLVGLLGFMTTWSGGLRRTGEIDPWLASLPLVAVSFASPFLVGRLGQTWVLLPSTFWPTVSRSWWRLGGFWYASITGLLLLAVCVVTTLGPLWLAANGQGREATALLVGSSTGILIQRLRRITLRAYRRIAALPIYSAQPDATAPSLVRFVWWLDRRASEFELGGMPLVAGTLFVTARTIAWLVRTFDWRNRAASFIVDNHLRRYYWRGQYAEILELFDERGIASLRRHAVQYPHTSPVLAYALMSASRIGEAEELLQETWNALGGGYPSNPDDPRAGIARGLALVKHHSRKHHESLTILNELRNAAPGDWRACVNAVSTKVASWKLENVGLAKRGERLRHGNWQPDIVVVEHLVY